MVHRGIRVPSRHICVLSWQHLRPGLVEGQNGALRHAQGAISGAGLPALTLLPYPGPVAKAPKKTCCTSKPRCQRCPIRMLAEGRLDPDHARKIFSKARNKKALKQAKLKKAKLTQAA